MNTAKIVSYSCEVEGCDYIFVQGMFVGRPPVSLINAQKGTVYPGCPIHFRGLVKHAENIAVERTMVRAPKSTYKSPLNIPKKFRKAFKESAGVSN